MTAYSLALTVHLLSVLLAVAGAALANFGSLRLRRAESAADAEAWLGVIHKVVLVFPFAVLGLLITGGYMTHDRWGWTTPWIDASLTGLGLIVVLGNGVDRIRLGALGRELATSGLSARARRLLRDPAAWTAKMMILGLVVAVVFVMTVKPGTVGCVGAIGAGLISGALSAVPLWRAPVPQSELEPST